MQINCSSQVLACKNQSIFAIIFTIIISHLWKRCTFYNSKDFQNFVVNVLYINLTASIFAVMKVQRTFGEGKEWNSVFTSCSIFMPLKCWSWYSHPLSSTKIVGVRVNSVMDRYLGTYLIIRVTQYLMFLFLTISKFYFDSIIKREFVNNNK